MDISAAHWNKLLYGIEKGECILLLGPELPVEMPDGVRDVPLRPLARRLLRVLDDDGLGDFDPQPSDLAWIAQRFVAQEDEVSLEMELVQWHRHWSHRSRRCMTPLRRCRFVVID